MTSLSPFQVPAPAGARRPVPRARLTPLVRPGTLVLTRAGILVLRSEPVDQAESSARSSAS